MSGQVASHTRSLPLLQGNSMTPSEHLPLERETPVGRTAKWKVGGGGETAPRRTKILCTHRVLFVTHLVRIQEINTVDHRLAHTYVARADSIHS